MAYSQAAGVKGRGLRLQILVPVELFPGLANLYLGPISE